ncbi:MAG TPA: YihY/virulence factor BrkB family protein [Candidatus Polarisedimenticolia bacterium]|nr:YihY/virulence factor BrkB family protein [Candidatus Polarisedimenticolia bacterium]
MMKSIAKNLLRATRRIFPGCVTVGQAIAFNMFLAFFPLLLLALGLLGATSHFHDALKEIPARLRMILPPGSSEVVTAYFVRKTVHPWRWIVLGLGGTLLAGMQMMVGYIEGFRIIEGDLPQWSYWRRQVRALAMICLTIVPMLAVVALTVFGKQTRAWLLQHTRSVLLTREIDLAFYAAAVFVLAMGTLVLLYRLGRAGRRGWGNLLPGALISTVLWWMVDILFGWYVRRTPYDLVYRGLASAIGLLLLMFLTAMIVFLGAAYNAEFRHGEATRGF